MQKAIPFHRQKFTFYDFHNQKHQFPKDNIKTVGDLKSKLYQLTRIPPQDQKIIINSKLKVTQDDASIAALEIRKNSLCVVLTKIKPTNPKQKAKLQKLYNDKKQESSKKIYYSTHQYTEEDIKRSEKIKKSKDTKQLLQQLIRDYDQFQSQLAIQQSQGNPIKAYQLLDSGKMELKRRQIQSIKQKQFIIGFLNMPEQQQLIETIKYKPSVYPKIMMKMYKKDRRFQQYQPKHKKFVRQEIFDRDCPYSSQDDEILYLPVETDDSDEKILKRIENLKGSIQKNQKKRLEDIQKLDKTILQFSQQNKISLNQAKKIFRNAGNNIKYAKFILNEGQINNSLNYTQLIKKNSQIQIISYFLDHPRLQEARKKMIARPKLAQLFLDKTIEIYKEHKFLIKLIKKYRQYAIKILTLQSQNLNINPKHNPNLNYVLPISPIEIRRNKLNIENSYSHRLLKHFSQSFTVNKRLLERIIRTSKNDLKKSCDLFMTKQLSKTYDFCSDDAKSQQNYLYQRFKKQTQLLTKMKNNFDTYRVEILTFKQTAPLLYHMIIKNINFFDSLVAGKAIKQQNLSKASYQQ